MLRRLRLGSQSVGGRRYPESPHPYRNDFQRDRDRITHSRAFRRLQGKTQVFAAHSGDHLRNRLTHTIEVSQVSRTVAGTLGLNEEYTETLALAHDLGHPPFGHVGERELDIQMQRFGLSFEHNLHALRRVDVLEQRYALFPGLNLTFEVREGIAKHSREISSDAEPHLQELLPGQRPPIEAQLIDPADEIAYNTADLDDAFASGHVTFEMLAEAVPFAAGLIEQTETQYPGASEQIRFWEVHRRLMNQLIGGLISGTLQAVEDSGVESAEDVRKLEHRVATLTPESALTNRQLKQLLVREAYSHPDLMEGRVEAVGKIRDLFEFLLSHPDAISARYREHLDDTPLPQVVCDYLAGMTDAFLNRTHARLIG